MYTTGLCLQTLSVYRTRFHSCRSSCIWKTFFAFMAQLWATRSLSLMTAYIDIYRRQNLSMGTKANDETHHHLFTSRGLTPNQEWVRGGFDGHRAIIWVTLVVRKQRQMVRVHVLRVLQKRNHHHQTDADWHIVYFTKNFITYIRNYLYGQRDAQSPGYKRIIFTPTLRTSLTSREFLTVLLVLF